MEYTGIKLYESRAEGKEIPGELNDFCEKIKDIDNEVEILNSSLELRSDSSFKTREESVEDEMSTSVWQNKRGMNSEMIKRIICSIMVLASVFVLLFTPFMTVSSKNAPDIVKARGYMKEQVTEGSHPIIGTMVAGVEKKLGIDHSSVMNCLNMILSGKYSLYNVTKVLKPFGSILSTTSGHVDNQKMKNAAKIYTIGQIFLMIYFVAIIILGLMTAIFILIGKRKRIDIAYYIFVIFGLAMIVLLYIVKGRIQTQMSNSAIAVVLWMFNMKTPTFDISLWPFLALVLAFPCSIYGKIKGKLAKRKDATIIPERTENDDFNRKNMLVEEETNN